MSEALDTLLSTMHLVYTSLDQNKCVDEATLDYIKEWGSKHVHIPEEPLKKISIKKIDITED